MSAANIQGLEELASSQHGYVTRAQAAREDVSDVDLVRLCKRGDLQRVEHGVYRFRGAGTFWWEPVWLAWLRLNPEQPSFERTRHPKEIVAGRTAAWIYELGEIDPEPYEFIVASRHQTRRADLRFRRSVVARKDWDVVNGLPVTRPHKIVTDLLAQHQDEGHVVDVAVDAVRKGLMSANELHASAKFAAEPDAFVDDVLEQSKK